MCTGESIAELYKILTLQIFVLAFDDYGLNGSVFSSPACAGQSDTDSWNQTQRI